MQKGETIVLTEADQKRIWRENEEKEALQKMIAALEKLNGSYEGLVQIFFDTVGGFADDKECNSYAYIVIDDFDNIVLPEKDRGEFLIEFFKNLESLEPTKK